MHYYWLEGTKWVVEIDVNTSLFNQDFLTFFSLKI